MIWHFLGNQIGLDAKSVPLAAENLSDTQLTRKYENCLNDKKLKL
jgi:hypothetical protein